MSATSAPPARQRPRTRRALAVGLGLGVLLYVALALAADLRALRALSAAYTWGTFPILLGLAGVNYAVRTLRWDLYLRDRGVRLPLGASVGIFLAGLFMAISPGKLGEVVKSALIKRRFGYPISATASVVVAERFTDLTSVLLLAVLGAAGLGVGWDIVGAGALLIGAFVVAVRWRAPFRVVFARLERAPRLAGVVAKAERVLDDLAALMRPWPLLLGNLVGLVAWGAEALAFALLLHGLGAPEVPLLAATFVYAIGALAGAVSMLPGGLVVTEGSMVGLLLLLHLVPDEAHAVFATLVIRLATLWFAVLVGMVGFLPWRQADLDAAAPGESALSG